MPLPSNLKDLYLEWIQELIDPLGSHQEQLSHTYEKAKKNLTDTDGTFYYPRDLKKVKGIGDMIMKRLEKKLRDFCKDQGFPEVDVFPEETTIAQNMNKRSMTALRSNSLDPSILMNGLPKKKKRKYIPKKRSGGYAILLGLLEANATTRGLTKDEVVEFSQKYSDHSMTPNFATKEMYGAWSSISSLKNNFLVLAEGRPKRYLLTDEGTELANTLKNADNIIFPNENNSDIPRFSSNRFNVADEVSANLSGLFPNVSNIHDEELTDSSRLLDITFGGINSSPNDNHKNNLTSRAHTTAISTPVTNSHNKVSLPRDQSEFLNSNDDDDVLKRRFRGTSYELWKRGTYEIFPIIDHREIKSTSNREFFTNSLQRKGMNSEIRQLSLGDIIWVAKNKISGYQCVLNTIIERKRLDDLAGSIRDNRFMEQKNRLEKSGCTNKIYLIEETVGNYLTGMGEALKTALWLILVYYRFSMIRTSNSEDTVEKLYALQMVIQKCYLKKDLIVIYPNDIHTQDDYRTKLDIFKEEFERSDNISCCHTFECFQDIMGKGDLKTIGELTIHTLLYIKGVSLEKAIAIQSIYPTLNHILMAYKNCKSESQAKLLLFQLLGDAPGAKKITKSLSEKIAEVFYDN